MLSGWLADKASGQIKARDDAGNFAYADRQAGNIPAVISTMMPNADESADLYPLRLARIAQLRLALARSLARST